MQKFIKIPVFFGYFSMVIAGFVMNRFGYKDKKFDPWFWKPALWISGIFTFAGYVMLGMIIDYASADNMGWIVKTSVLLLFTTLSCTFGVYIVLNIAFNNFSRTYNMILPIILVVYYKVSWLFEFSIRISLFEDMPFHIYFAIVGGTILLSFIIASFVLDTVDDEDSLREKIGCDKRGMIIHLLVDSLFLTVLFFVKLILHHWTWALMVYVGLLLINLIIPFLVLIIASIRYDDIKIFEYFQQGIGKFKDLAYSKVIVRPDFIAMAFVSAIVIGTTNTFISKTESF